MGMKRLMRSARAGAIIAVGVIIGAATGCRGSRAYADPPANTYSAAAFYVGIDSTKTNVSGATVEQGFFEAAKVQPVLGRLFITADYGAAQRTVILGNDLWKQRFQSAPTAIGQTIQVNGRPAVIVGVLPPGFAVPKGAMLWEPSH
jgi:MacB-like periplasmic core domain